MEDDSECGRRGYKNGSGYGVPVPGDGDGGVPARKEHTTR
jgi:hypothetical protein